MALATGNLLNALIWSAETLSPYCIKLSVGQMFVRGGIYIAHHPSIPGQTLKVDSLETFEISGGV